MYDNLGFFNFLYLPQIIDLFHLHLSILYQKYFSVILSFFSYSLGVNKLVYFNKLLGFNIKSINPVSKYQHLIES